MLSRIDIQNELGKGIKIFPINLKNFKDNSLNLCAGYLCLDTWKWHSIF